MRYAKVLIRVLLIISMIALVSIMLVTVSPPVNVAEEVATQATDATEPTQIELINDPILFSEVGYDVPKNSNEALNNHLLMEDYIRELKIAIGCDLYSDEAKVLMNAEIDRLQSISDRFAANVNTFTSWEEEYPEATTVWYYLREQGYSEEVSAGILGNMMVETSGGTLHLKPMIYNPNHTYYGLCQWSMYYYPQVRGLDIYEQLDFLMDTIEKEFKSFGHVYKKKFTYDSFLALQSPEDAALAFAKVYERCSSGSYSLRKRCARIAYEYFTLTEEVYE